MILKTQIINKIIKEIELDILGRKGIGDELDLTHKLIRKEILEAWFDIVDKHLQVWHGQLRKPTDSFCPTCGASTAPSIRL